MSKSTAMTPEMAAIAMKQLKHDLELAIMRGKTYSNFSTVNYNIIAKLIRDNTYVDRKGRPEINTLAFLMDMCKTFKEDNEGFKEEMFLKACGVTKE